MKGTALGCRGGGAGRLVQFRLCAGGDHLGLGFGAAPFGLNARVTLVLQQEQHNGRRNSGSARDGGLPPGERCDHRRASRRSSHLIVSRATPHPAMNTARAAVSRPSTAAC